MNFLTNHHLLFVLKDLDDEWWNDFFSCLVILSKISSNSQASSHSSSSCGSNSLAENAIKKRIIANDFAMKILASRHIIFCLTDDRCVLPTHYHHFAFLWNFWARIKGFSMGDFVVVISNKMAAAALLFLCHAAMSLSCGFDGWMLSLIESTTIINKLVAFQSINHCWWERNKRKEIEKFFKGRTMKNLKWNWLMISVECAKKCPFLLS